MRIDVGLLTCVDGRTRAVPVFFLRSVLRRMDRQLIFRSILSLTRDRKVWKLACFVEVEGGITMSLDTILYISDKAISSDSVLGALKNTGYEVVSADSASQGIALLFLMRSVAAVVLHDQARERAGFDVPRTLLAIRPDVSIILLCRDQIDRLPSCVDVCVSLAQPLEMVISAVRRLLTAANAGLCPL